jgi:hypothetical protein
VYYRSIEQVSQKKTYDDIFRILRENLTACRYLIREAYKIPEAFQCEDVVCGTCCIPCTVAQLIQSTKKRGNPTTNGGRSFNTQVVKQLSNHDFGEMFCLCCKIAFCPCCVQADLLTTAIGGSWWSECISSWFCGQNLFTTRNILRYHYRIKSETGNDCTDECLSPIVFDCCLSGMIPCYCCVKLAAITKFTMDMKSHMEAVEAQRTPDGKLPTSYQSLCRS